MPTDFAFRFSTYLTLAVACACLGYAEWDYLPEVTLFTGAVAVALVAAFRAEWRFSLTLTAANWVGAGIFLAAVVWIGVHWRNDHSLIHTLPWPAGLLPYLGPIVMTAIVAKLFRPKHVGDWWTMHGMGLAAVGLAASLTEDGAFVGLLVAYAVCGVWSLTLFYQRRAAGLIPPVPPADAAGGMLDVGAWFPWLAGGGEAAPVVAGPPPDRHRPAVGRFGRSHARKALGWLALAGLFAFPLFFATPRSDGTHWQLRRSRMETGYTAESAVDLTRTGELEASRETAFEVTATDRAGIPRDDLPPDLRWRGRGFVEYDTGKWTRTMPRRLAAPRGDGPTGPVSNARLPDLGPDHFVLEYKLNPKARVGIVLADPVVYDPGQTSPFVYDFAGTSWAGQQGWDGSFGLYPPNSRVSRYRQAYRVSPDRSQGVPFALAPGADTESLGRILAVLPQSQPVVQWSRRLLDRMIADGKLPAAVDAGRREYDPLTLSVAPQDRRAVAEAFRDYLADGREFQYSLTLTRQNKLIDPIEDFLFHTKTGHCERFATALVLMLRSVGIPAQFVLGFKGCDPLDDGKYVVRQEHAHAWVEALIPADAAGRQWQWLTLDPTPLVTDEPTAEGVAGLWDAARQTGRRIFTDYIVGLTPDTQRQLSGMAREAVSDNGPYVGAGIGLAAGLALVAVRVRRRGHGQPGDTAPPPDAAPWFTRMVAVLAPRGLHLAPGVTPGEYARRAAADLGRDPALAALADVPVRVAAAVYETRYAGAALPAGRLAAVERDIDALAAALSSRPEQG